mmetsp:Transcript_960/g.1200  ORF Transcript_960/g.1200 Transcript_960/m.1200 type:complete len:296 (+) Transcript_960:91-978(+)
MTFELNKAFSATVLPQFEDSNPILLPGGSLPPAKIGQRSKEWKLPNPNIYKNTKILVVGEKQYEICPDALSLHSGYFRSMFSSFQEKKSETISLELPNESIFADLLPFLHSGLIEYQLVTLENCCRMVRLAEYLSCEKLLDHLMECIAANLSIVQHLDEFCSENIPLHFIVKLFSVNRQSTIDSPKSTIEFLFKWSRDYSSSQINLEEIAALVKKYAIGAAKGMSLAELKSLKNANPYLFSSLDCLDLLSLWESEEQTLKRKLVGSNIVERDHRSTVTLHQRMNMRRRGGRFSLV